MYFCDMKQFLTLRLAVALAGVLWVAADVAGVLDPSARIAMSGSLGRQYAPDGDGAAAYVPMIIELESEADFDRLAAEGVVTFGRRDNLVLACVPADKVDDLSHSNYVMRMTLSRRVDASLDLACRATHVTDLHDGAVGMAGLTGQGVVAGFADSGFDPSHEAFAGRVASVTHFAETRADVRRARGESEIAAWETDNSDMYHATHVAGILSGDGPSPYRGVAPGATVVAATSELHDAAILACVEEVISYARENHRPAVINLSLGSTMGPHDGTDPFCRYLDMCAEEAVVVMSAGNDGAREVSLSHVFSLSRPELASLITQRYYGDFYHLSGAYDCWSRDSRPFKVRFRAFNSYTKQYVWTGDWITAGEEIVELNTEAIPELAAYFTGSIKLAGEVNPANGRFNTMVVFDITALQTSPLGPWALHHLEIDVTAEPGTGVDLYAESSQCMLGSYNLPGQTAGSPAQSISNLACGNNTVAVGSVNTRHDVTYIDGRTETWASIGEGAMTATSSYGVLADGRRLPHICAPGAMIISAASPAYFAGHPEEAADLSYRTPGGDAYWALTGTSMAAPHVAGIFALWLEADPTLTPSELRDIAVETATPIADGHVREGAGCIDALAGLRRIIDRGGILSAGAETVFIRRAGGRVEIEVPGSTAFTTEVYDMAGRRISSDALPDAPVIVRVVTPYRVFVRKI